MTSNFDETEDEANERIKKQVKHTRSKKGTLKQRKVTKSWSLPAQTVSKIKFLTKHFELERDSIMLVQMVDFIYENRSLIKRIGE